VHNKGCKEASLSPILASLQYYHRSLGLPWLTEQDVFVIQQVRVGLRKAFFRPRVAKFPITFARIEQVHAHLSPDSLFPHLEFLALCRLGHDALLRLGELLSLRCTHLQLTPISPLPVQLPSDASPPLSALLRIHKSKRNKTGPPEELVIPYYGPDSTPMLLHTYLQAYRSRFAASSPFSDADFLFPSWAPTPRGPPRPSTSLPRALLLHALRTFFPSSPASHSGYSFRSGGASDLADLHVPHELIKSVGRWKSDAYLLYIKLNPQRDSAVLASAFTAIVARTRSVPSVQASTSSGVPVHHDTSLTLSLTHPTTGLGVVEPSTSHFVSGQVDGDIASPK
jgi:hypothetical protein